MKTKHELENGTVLEVGKKYRSKEWLKGEFIEVKYLGDKSFFSKDESRHETSFKYSLDLVPYEEAKKPELLYEWVAKQRESSKWNMGFYLMTESDADYKLSKYHTYQKTGRKFKEVNGVLTEIK